MEVSVLSKVKKCLMWLVAHFLVYLFFGYGWRGFFPRIIVAILAFILGDAGAPEYNTASGGKLKLLACGLFIYAIGKLIYDYTKIGKDAESEERNER